MNDLTEKVKEGLAQLARAQRSEARLQTQLDNAVAPHEKLYLKEIKPFQEKFEPKLSKVRDRIAALEKEISAQVLEIAEGEVIVPRVEANGIIAEANAVTRRTVKAYDFFQLVPSNQRDVKFYGCLNVLIGKASKLVGDKLNEIASSKKSWKVKIYRGKSA
jgi:CHAT domain-containing protein